jgi:phosphoribosylaminoimidazole carboxylase PurK protein
MNKKRIGIVGGGQLGRMLTDAAHDLGFWVTVLDPMPNSPAGQVADAQLLGSFKDAEKIFELAAMSDVMTFEIESANAEALEKLVSQGFPVHPKPGTLVIIKDKYKQKFFLQKHGIPVGDFVAVNSIKEVAVIGERFGYPFLLKARFDAYDGRGNVVVAGPVEIQSAYTKLGGGLLYAEKFVPFVKELAVVSARGTTGEIVTFPVVETVHKNNICHIVRSPAPVSIEIQQKAESVARDALTALSGVGVFAVEMFFTETGDILVNEIAPRVHNSGHHTIEAFVMSQFEAHIRAITGMPFVDPKPRAAASVMVNILGEREGPAELSGQKEAETLGGVTVHVYGKLETRMERKMGHITAVADTLEEAEIKALQARKHISI